MQKKDLKRNGYNEIWLSREEVSILQNIKKSEFWNRFKKGDYKKTHYQKTFYKGKRRKLLQIALSCLDISLQIEYLAKLNKGQGDNKGQETMGGQNNIVCLNDKESKTSALIEKKAPHSKQELAKAKYDLLVKYNEHTNNQNNQIWGKKITAKGEFVRAYNSGALYPEIYNLIGDVSPRSIERWKDLIENSADPVDALVNHNINIRKGVSSINEEQLKILLSCALHPNKPKKAEAIRIARSAISVRGIQNVLSPITYRRALDKWISTNYHIWVFNREGAKAWNDKCAFSIERDYDLINVGDIAVADGHVLNFEILNPWTGKPSRMVLILWYDMKANFPLGWEIMAVENTQAIASALRRAILRLGKLPQIAYLDNGKAFGARFFNGRLDQAGFNGLFARLGIRTIFAWPYHAQSKTIERFFETFAELERWMPTYTGTSIKDKPPRLMRGERLHKKVYDKIMNGSCLTLTQAHVAIATWFDEYAGRKQRGHLDGRSPAEVFIEGKGPGVDKVKLNFLMMSQDVRSIGRRGIRFLGEDYYAPALYSRRHPVVVQYDIQDLSSILVFDQDGETLICEAPLAGKIHPAAQLLGTKKDQEKLQKTIELKRHQEKEASASARAFLENEIIPEHQRLLKDMGIHEMPLITDPNKETGRKPGKLTAAEKETIARQVKELEELQKELPPRPPDEVEYISQDIEDTAGIWTAINAMPDIERYKKLLELEVRDWLIPKEHKAWMCYFEQTLEYERYKQYFEKYRVKVILTHKCGQTEEPARI